MLKTGKVIAGFVAILALFQAASSCAGANTTSDKGSFSLDLVWPAGYGVDQQSWTIYPPAGSRDYAAQAYVTRATLTLTNPLGESVAFDIPLDTGLVTGSALPGDYLLSVMVETSMGLVFTGQAKVTLYPGLNPDILISLVINAPPTIDTFTVSDSKPRPDTPVTFTVAASDLDGDPLTYTWAASAGKIIGADTSASWSSPTAVDAKVTVTVSDGRGGFATASLPVSAINLAPVISSVTSSNLAPLFNAVVTLDCVAADPEMDPITYTWSSSSDAWKATGATVTYTVSTPKQTTITCTVTDLYGAVSTGTVILNQGSNGIPGAPQSVVATGGLKQATVSWGAVTNAISYNLYWGLSAAAITNKIPVGGTIYTHTTLPDGATYYYKITAVTVVGEGPASLVVSALTLPATPTGLTATAGNGVVNLSWLPSASATGYNIQWGNASGVLVNTLAVGAVSSYVHTVPNWQWYFYTVTAVNGTGQSGPTGEVSAYPNSGALGGVTGIAMSSVSDTGVSAADAYTFDTNPIFIWNALPGAEGYTVALDGVFYANVPTASAQVAVTAGTHSITVNGYNTTLGLTGPIVTFPFTIDLTAAWYVGYTTDLLLCLNSAFPSSFTFNYNEPVWLSSLSVASGNATVSYTSGSGSTSITTSVTNNFLNITNVLVSVGTKDQAGNSNMLGFTIVGPCG
ncbi:MAG: hypothetical protein OEV92_06045 [Nitrospinota bacterium]|nr:hypothetical protein [Nitrospinota bacterium]